MDQKGNGAFFEVSITEKNLLISIFNDSLEIKLNEQQ